MNSALNNTPVSLETQRLASLQALLADRGIDAYWVPSADAHLNEYVPTPWKRREWLTGFTGSAGDLLVTLQQAYLFADSRYHQQADQEVNLAQVTVIKMGLPEAPDFTTLMKQLIDAHRQPNDHAPPFTLGFDPATVPVSLFGQWQKNLPEGVHWLPTSDNWVDGVAQQLLLEVPETEPTEGLGTSTLFAMPQTVTGLSFAEKCALVRQEMKTHKIESLALTKLDQIAWLLNWRGEDVAYNPVFIAYAVLTLQQCHLFTRQERIPQMLLDDLPTESLSVHAYEAYLPYLRQAPRPMGLDTAHTTMATLLTLRPAEKTVDGPIPVLDEATLQAWGIRTVSHPVEWLKARKNDAEVAAMVLANRQASRAKIRLLSHVQAVLASEQFVSEKDVADTIERFYREEPNFVGLSFNVIAGAGANSAIVHYGTPSETVKITHGEWLLVDSGAHYTGGTTDATRTVVMGEMSEANRTAYQYAYTMVLKAHIACARQVFPAGTTGIQLDGITRAPLWQSLMEFGHGTGHGVGACLNVHEGPQGIHKRASVPLEPGMVVSIEPGFYIPNWGGIRIENLAVVEAVTPEAEAYLPPAAQVLKETANAPTQWYRFRLLTWIPMCQALINPSLLTPDERDWLNTYHQRILSEMECLATLPAETARWLQQECRPIS